MGRCVGCQSAESSPSKFLLTCARCARSWHHRCHRPVITDAELIPLIRRFSQLRKLPNGPARVEWTCAPCVATIAEVIVIDDDDDPSPAAAHRPPTPPVAPQPVSAQATRVPPAPTPPIAPPPVPAQAPTRTVVPHPPPPLPRTASHPITRPQFAPKTANPALQAGRKSISAPRPPSPPLPSLPPDSRSPSPVNNLLSTHLPTAAFFSRKKIAYEDGAMYPDPNDRAHLSPKSTTPPLQAGRNTILVAKPHGLSMPTSSSSALKAGFNVPRPPPPLEQDELDIYVTDDEEAEEWDVKELDDTPGLAQGTAPGEGVMEVDELVPDSKEDGDVLGLSATLSQNRLTAKDKGKSKSASREASASATATGTPTSAHIPTPVPNAHSQASSSTAPLLRIPDWINARARSASINAHENANALAGSASTPLPTPADATDAKPPRPPRARKAFTVVHRPSVLAGDTATTDLDLDLGPDTSAAANDAEQRKGKGKEIEIERSRVVTRAKPTDAFFFCLDAWVLERVGRRN